MKLNHVWRFMLRNYKFNILWIITITSTLLLLYQVQFDITNSISNLEELSNNTEVTATIRIKSTSIDYIPYELIQDIEHSDFIENSSLSSVYKAYVAYPYSNLSINGDHEKLVVDYFKQEDVLSVTSLQLLDSYEPILDKPLMDSLKSNNWLIIEEKTLAYEQLSIGDEMIISGEYIPSNYYNLPSDAYSSNSLTGLTFIIVGTFKSDTLSTSNIRYIANNNYILNNFREYIIHEQIQDELYPFIGHIINPIPHVDSAIFTLRNKMELSTFKTLVNESILPRFFYYELLIDDALHEAITAPLRKQIKLKENLLILIMSILILIQFLITFISTYRKKSLIALLRMSGNKTYEVFLNIFTEHIITCLMASAIFILYLFITKVNTISALNNSSFFLFYLSYCIGTSLSAIIILNKAPMSLLFKKE